MPWPRRRAVLCSELETAPSTLCRMRARASMNQATVEPVPTPTIIPSSTNSMAFSAASRLASVMAFGIGDRGLLLLLAFQRQQQLPLRRGHRQHRQARALAGQGEVFTQRVCIVADRLQRDRGVELAHRSEEPTSELQSLMRISY